MALAVYVDDVLLFGPDGAKMNKVLDELQLAGLELKTEKDEKDTSYDFLGINVAHTKNEDGTDIIKLTQLGLIKKFLECVCMTECNSKATPCIVQPLGQMQQV